MAHIHIHYNTFYISFNIVLYIFIYSYTSTDVTILEKEDSGVAPTFTQPIKITETEEKNILITCQVYGSPVPNIKWFKGLEEVIPSETVQIIYEEDTGYTALELLNPAEQSSLYTVQADNVFGRAIGNANISLQKDTIKKKTKKIKKIKAPKILTPLQALVVKNATSILFEVEFTADLPYEINWLKNGKEVVLEDSVVITTTESTTNLTIKNVDRKRSGKYEVVIKNPSGEARSSGSVVVTDDKESLDIQTPRFIEPLSPKMVVEDDVVILEAIVESNPVSSFQWFINGVPVKSNDITRIVTRENKSILMIETFKKTNVGSYTCRAENVGGSVTSTASINIIESYDDEEVSEFKSPSFVQKIKPVAVMDGEKLYLECKVQGSPIPKVQWFHNNQLIKETKDISILQDNSGICSLTISEVFPEDGGEYSCKAINTLGEAVCSTQISVEGILIYVYVYIRISYVIKKKDNTLTQQNIVYYFFYVY